MPKRTDPRRSVIIDAKKGKIDDFSFHAMLKYNFDAAGREYILNHLSPKYFAIAYNNPKPSTHLTLRQNQIFLNQESTLLDEIIFFLEGLSFYKNEINHYLEINKKFEQSFLNDEFESCLDHLDHLDDEAGFSLYSILCEYLVNDVSGEFEANKDLLRYLSSNHADQKVLVLMNLTRFRIDQKISSLSYEGAVEQHRKLYNEKTSAQYLDYINFKFDHLNAIPFKDYRFILTFDSDFSVIDRYQSLRRLLPYILGDDDINQSIKDSIIEMTADFSHGIKDDYWINFRTLYQQYNGPYNDRSEFHAIQDDIFDGNYLNVVEKCSRQLKAHPNYAELFVPFIQALILTNKKLDTYFPEKTELSKLLGLMKNVLQKGPNYNADRERLLKIYYTISHLDFSFHILEFIYNEYNLLIKEPIQTISFLNSATLRYNAFKLFTDNKRLVNLLNVIPYKTEQYLKRLIQGEETEFAKTTLQMKVKIGYEIKSKQYIPALEALLRIKKDLGEAFDLDNFVNSWIQRNIIKCFFGLGELGKASDVIVESFFLTQHAYAHFLDHILLSKLSDPFETRYSEHISIPILFEIYNSPQSAMYDVIANFLLANGVKRPSELLPFKDKWNPQYLHYFLERCCIKENLEDSPFFKKITMLEDERIKLINYLKAVEPEKIDEYNREILTISRDASLRKGLLQIHESRIYVDIKGILKVRELHLRELFDTYITLNDLNNGHVSAMKLGDLPQTSLKDVTYYFVEPIDEETLLIYDLINDYAKDLNVVQIPEIKYQYFVAQFMHLRTFFVFDEDYGFKSFLSMRIRHGTFSNVLRTVFEKHNLISSKASNSNIYQDIKHWENDFNNEPNYERLQLLFKTLSSDVDQIIETALGWLVIKEGDHESQQGFFDFRYVDEELYSLFRNRVGRITTFEGFADEVFKILFERLEYCLTQLRYQISTVLVSSFVSALDELQKEVSKLNLQKEEIQSIDQYIVDCRTEIQGVISQIENWFRISKNRYIEEFPIELILETIINYLNSIYAGALAREPNVEIKCAKNIKGKYFEPFGDLFINLLENIVTKNKDIIDDMVINIFIEEENELINIKIDNSLSPTITREELEVSINGIKDKIANYKNGSDVSFEKGSGYIKLCKSIAVDLERVDYTVVPRYIDDHRFEVTVSFSTENLFA
jgi:hypothetical protein